jgi:phospholipid transport system substrate-binding protein
MKNIRAAAIALSLMSATWLAAPAWADAPEAAPIAAMDAALIAVMKAGSANASFQSRYDQLDPAVRQALNLPVILQNSVGVEWSTIPAAQQQQLEKIFEQFTVASYVNGFGSYGGQKIEVLPAERDLGAKKIVETQIVPADGSAQTRLDYVMGNSGSGWQATDVLFNGTISKVAIQSSDFSSLVNSGDASGLISALKTKVATLSGGELKD